MRIDQALNQLDRPCFSFEFFPPKTAEGEKNLFAALTQLAELDPDYVSVTWGAGGSTQTKTIEIISKIKQQFGLEAMAHFTCVGATTGQLRDALEQMQRAGIQNVLALRGDPPAGSRVFTKTEGGLAHASELVELIQTNYDFTTVAACYPEKHPEAVSLQEDLKHLKTKVDAGAKVLVTQLFFDNSRYFEFVDAARAAGINVPIVPGIMPIAGFEQIKRFTSMCGATIPAALLEQLELRSEHPEAVVELGTSYATLQCAELLAGGAPGIHFYTLNRSSATRAILSALKLQQPWKQQRRSLAVS